MDAVFEIPSKADKRIAKDVNDFLKESTGGFVKAKHPVEMVIKGNTVKVPAKAARILCEVIENMAKGDTFAIVKQDRMLSPLEAAQYLNISRPYMMKLIKAKEIPVVSIGTQLKIILSDLQAFDRAIRANRITELAFYASNGHTYEQIMGEK
jgi:excisionase family DNA binding protein